MINNQDNTFQWETNDIITADLMNRLLLEDNVILLEDQPLQEDNIKETINLSYNELYNLNLKNNIIFVKESSDNDINYYFYLLENLYFDQVSSKYKAVFTVPQGDDLLYTADSNQDKLIKQ